MRKLLEGDQSYLTSYLTCDDSMNDFMWLHFLFRKVNLKVWSEVQVHSIHSSHVLLTCISNYLYSKLIRTPLGYSNSTASTAGDLSLGAWVVSTWNVQKETNMYNCKQILNCRFPRLLKDLKRYAPAFYEDNLYETEVLPNKPPPL